MGDWSQEGREPTPEEWVEWFLSMSTDRQVIVAQRLIANAKAAVRCVTEKHEAKASRWDKVMEIVRGDGRG